MKNQIIAVLLLSVIISVLVPFLTPGKGQADFKAYWAAAAVIVRGGNPYDPNDMLAIQQEVVAGQEGNTNLVLNAWNPPWLILLMVPLGWLPFNLAAGIWMFINLLFLGIMLILTWDMLIIQNGDRGFPIVLVVGYFFIPTIILISMGQISSLVLLGIILGLRWIQKTQDWLAGSALLLTTIKPHLSYFLLLLIFVWVVQNRRWKIIGGMAVAALLSLGIFFILLPGWPGDYITLIRSMPYTQIYTSTVGSLMAAVFGIKLFYLSAVLILFLIRPLLNLVRSEGWLVPANFSLLVGIPLSPFGFLFDQILLLPAIIQIIAWIWSKELRGVEAIVIAGCTILVNIGVLMLVTLEEPKYYYWFVWAPLALLVIYFIAWKIRYVRQS
jgi:hypothetical protein